MRSIRLPKRVSAALNWPATAQRPPLVREALLVTALYLAYKFGRLAANGQFDAAYDNAERVWDLQRALHLPSEAWVQDALLHSETLIRAINVYYATVHFPATVLFLVWMYWRRPGHYVWIRWVLTWLTGAALVLHLLVPLAPPRLFGPADMIDTGEVYGPAVYDEPDPDSMANQFAAMPSLHVGWAVVIALGLIVATRTRWRWLWLAHPLITLVAVAATAHHYWLDGLVACALLAVIVLALRPPRRAPSAEPPEADRTDGAVAEPAEPVKPAEPAEPAGERGAGATDADGGAATARRGRSPATPTVTSTSTSTA